jgi:hypothetical protein
MSTTNNYDGPFDPDFDFKKLSRTALARVGREYMLFQHVNDRAVHPMLIGRFGAQADIDVVNDEWMGSSPIYNRRVRKLLKIEGDDVSAVFKGLQTDVGFPHQFQAVKYEVKDETHGTFWLDYCGPYAHIAAAAGGHPKAIKQLCWDMEDTTFPATTMAVNPKAGCLPIHRPPLPADHTGPICKWEVTISDRHETVEKKENERIISQSKAAQFEYPAPTGLSSEGINDYSGPFIPDLVLEDFSQPALVSLCKEFSMDGHLLVRGVMLSIRRRWGEDVMKEIARLYWISSASVYVERIRRALNIQGNDMGAILKTLQVDPSFPHDYVEFGCALVDEKRGYFWINDCAMLSDEEPRGWLTLLSDDDSPGFDAVVTAVNPKARCRPADPAGLESGSVKPVCAWEIVIDDDAEPRVYPEVVEPLLSEELRNFPFTSASSE